MKLQPKPQPDREFVDLVQRVLDHEASLNDIEHLNARLPRDSVALRYFVEMQMLHGSLEDEFGATAGNLASMDGRLVNFPGKSSLAGAAAAQAPASGKRRRRKWLAGAAALIAIGLGFLVGDRILHPPAFEVIAHHGTGLGSVPTNGKWVHSGETLKLGGGAVELRSRDGNSITFQGPGELTVHKPNRLSFETGRLWAELEGESVHIRVARGEVTDLGTTFGIDQSAATLTRIDVFDGKVQFSDPADPTRLEEAAKGESLESSGADWTPEKGEADAGRYIAGIRRPLGLTFVSGQEEASRITAAFPFGAAWTPGSAAVGKVQLSGSPVVIQWSGSRLHSFGAAASPDAAVLHTHLCGYPWVEFGPDGFNPNNKKAGDGISIQLKNLAAWMEQIGATGYQITILHNSENPAAQFFPISVFRGQASPENLVNAFQAKPDDYQQANYPDGPGGRGARLVHQLPARFVADLLTLESPPHTGGQSLSNISGIILTPVF